MGCSTVRSEALGLKWCCHWTTGQRGNFPLHCLAAWAKPAAPYSVEKKRWRRLCLRQSQWGNSLSPRKKMLFSSSFQSERSLVPWRSGFFNGRGEHVEKGTHLFHSEISGILLICDVIITQVERTPFGKQLEELRGQIDSATQYLLNFVWSQK